MGQLIGYRLVGEINELRMVVKPVVRSNLGHDNAKHVRRARDVPSARDDG